MTAFRNARPFLKWAGGKRQLLPVLRRFYPVRFSTYYEPFLGSGAVFFDLCAAGLLDDRSVLLTDINPDVVGCYLAVRDDLDGVISELHALAQGHAARGATHYYEIREERFNPWRRELFASAASASDAKPVPYPAALAAMLIYLNRTGYNGLFRLNRQGAFNVPVGRYANPTICDADTLRAVSFALNRPGVELAHASFDVVASRAAADAFVYFDPPYAPLTPTSRFTSYTRDGFDDVAQARLQRLILALARQGCHVLLSNSTAPSIRALYDDNTEASEAGLRAFRVPARRAINSNARKRRPIGEYVVTNIPKRRTLAARRQSV